MIYLFRPVDHPTQSFLYTSTKKYFIGKHNSFQARNNTKFAYLKKKKLSIIDKSSVYLCQSS